MRSGVLRFASLPCLLALVACGYLEGLKELGGHHDQGGSVSAPQPRMAAPRAQTITADHDGMLAPVHLDGDKFVDDQGKQVAIHGVNFFGFNTPNATLHGLWGSDPIGSDFQTIVWRQKLLGFNAVRLPFSFKSFAGTPQATAKPCDLNVAAQVKGLTADPQDSPTLISDPPPLAHPADGKGQCNGYLPTSSSRDQYLWVVDFYVQNGFYVLVDNHSEDHTVVEGADDWAQKWAQLVSDIMAKDGAKGRVFADILNEPDQVGGRWSDGPVNMGDLYIKAMDAIWSKSQDIIFFVEGMAQAGTGANWGDGFCHDDASVQAGASDPRGFFDKLLGKPYAKHVVLSPHIYGPSVTHAPAHYKDQGLYDRLDLSFGSKTKGSYKNVALPIAVGEFGSTFKEPEDVAAMESIAKYLTGQDGSSAHNPIPHWFYWDWNPDSGDTGGLVGDDWRTVEWDKLRFLRSKLGLTPWYATPLTPAASTSGPAPTPKVNGTRASQPGAAASAPKPADEQTKAPAPAPPPAPAAEKAPEAPPAPPAPPPDATPQPAAPPAPPKAADSPPASTAPRPPETVAQMPISDIAQLPLVSGPNIAKARLADIEVEALLGIPWKDPQGRYLSSLNLVIHAPRNGTIQAPWTFELGCKDYVGVSTSWGLSEVAFRTQTLYAKGTQGWQSMGNGGSSAVNVGAIMIQKGEKVDGLRLVINGMVAKITYH